MYYPIIDTVHKGIEDVFGDDDDDDKAETRPIHRLKRLDMEDEEDTRPLQTDMNPEQVRNYCYKIICAGSHYQFTSPLLMSVTDPVSFSSKSSWRRR